MTNGDIDYVTTETNRYARSFLVENKVASSSVLQWPQDGITANNVVVFLALTYYMGLLKKDLVRDYWSTDNILSTPFPSSVMSCNDFQNILSFCIVMTHQVM